LLISFRLDERGNPKRSHTPGGLIHLQNQNQEERSVIADVERESEEKGAENPKNSERPESLSGSGLPTAVGYMKSKSHLGGGNPTELGDEVAGIVQGIELSEERLSEKPSNSSMSSSDSLEFSSSGSNSGNSYLSIAPPLEKSSRWIRRSDE
jgi:hypothetical protein